MHTCSVFTVSRFCVPLCGWNGWEIYILVSHHTHGTLLGWFLRLFYGLESFQFNVIYCRGLPSGKQLRFFFCLLKESRLVV